MGFVLVRWKKRRSRVCRDRDRLVNLKVGKGCFLFLGFQLWCLEGEAEIIGGQLEELENLNDNFYIEGDRRISLRDKIVREVVSNLLIYREFANPFPKNPTKAKFFKNRMG